MLALEDRSPGRAYPRAGGGTANNTDDIPPEKGLSPRRRGNRPGGLGGAHRRGPIPAQAGEPKRSRRTKY